MSGLRGEWIRIGSEFLEERESDFFTPLLRGTLADLGIRLVGKRTVADEEEALAAQLRQALECSHIVVTTGRMGQEERDLTRKVLAKVTKRRLVLAEIPESGGRQILVPFGAVPVAGMGGKTPGLLLELDGNWVIALPHPISVARSSLLRTLPLLSERRGFLAGSGVLLRTCGLGLRQVFDRIKGIELPPGSQLELLPSAIGVDLEFFAKSREDRLTGELLLREWLGMDFYGVGGETLEGEVARLLTSAGKRIALAESCTGGAIAERLTRIPGSSAFFDRALVTYSNSSKIELLGTDPDLFARHGAVSREVALAMAEGTRKRSGADIGLSVTGIAGPAGGTDQKPVGLVFIGLSAPAGLGVWQHYFEGDREAVRAQGAARALDYLRRFLLGLDLRRTETEEG